jgi:hypothetical protein
VAHQRGEYISCKKEGLTNGQRYVEALENRVERLDKLLRRVSVTVTKKPGDAAGIPSSRMLRCNHYQKPILMIEG